jgi:threonine/homoserine/homoserine lactone efflux protein
MLTELVAFVPVAAVVICTPGPDTALTIRNAVAGGRKAGILTAAGVAIGQGVWTVAASLGLTSLLRASAPAFLALKVAGAAYLIVLGIQSLRAARARRGHDADACPPKQPMRPVRALRQGLVNDLGLWLAARAAILGRRWRAQFSGYRHPPTGVLPSKVWA